MESQIKEELKLRLFLFVLLPVGCSVLDRFGSLSLFDQNLVKIVVIIDHHFYFDQKLIFSQIVKIKKNILSHGTPSAIILFLSLIWLMFDWIGLAKLEYEKIFPHHMRSHF